MNSVINYYRNTLFSFGINFAEINLETLPCFSERSKKIPNGKHAFERGGKNSSEFLSSCNEDNLIKIKAKLIKNLKAQAFGCVISLKYGRLGLLSWAQFLVVQTGYASGSEWKCAAGLQFSDHSFWPFCSFLVFLLLCFWKKPKQPNNLFWQEFPFSPMSFVWVWSWGQSIWGLLSLYRFYSWISWFVP